MKNDDIYFLCAPKMIWFTSMPWVYIWKTVFQNTPVLWTNNKIKFHHVPFIYTTQCTHIKDSPQKWGTDHCLTRKIRSRWWRWGHRHCSLTKWALWRVATHRTRGIKLKPFVYTIRMKIVITFWYSPYCVLRLVFR